MANISPAFIDSIKLGNEERILRKQFERPAAFCGTPDSAFAKFYGQINSQIHAQSSRSQSKLSFLPGSSLGSLSCRLDTRDQRADAVACTVPSGHTTAARFRVPGNDRP